MKSRSKILFLVQRIGPYHHTRLLAFAEAIEFDLVAIEFRSNESVYAWDSVLSGEKYVQRRLTNREDLPSVLAEYHPRVIVCVGYSDPEIHVAMCWALEQGVPLVTCSDSTFVDERRSWIKELSKRALIAAFDTALVAGQRSRDYLGRLGLHTRRCFYPWDVVDNKYFEEGAACVVENTDEEKRSRGLPGQFFLGVGRFVQKKNFPQLIRAYRHYVTTMGNNSWGLVLAGSGPLEAQLRFQAENEGVGNRVTFAGLVGYKDLPRFYGLAEAFVMPSSSDQWGLVVNEAMAAGLPVLVSERCGCAPDLVKEGRNGFLFDPENVQQLAACMVRLHRTDPVYRREMGQQSREIIAGYSPKAFAHGLKAAVECALEKRDRRKSLTTRLAVRSLASRKLRAIFTG